MKRIILIITLVLTASLSGQKISAQENDSENKITTVVIVRHAEKESDSANPPLKPEGEKRAETLAKMLNNSEISAVFSTDYLRTKETVNNCADQFGLKIIIYDKVQDLAANIKSNYEGKKVLVAAHSNTIGAIIKALGAGEISEIGYYDYNDLFIVTICFDGSASSIHLEYEVHQLN